jgi:hypothetical protein
VLYTRELACRSLWQGAVRDSEFVLFTAFPIALSVSTGFATLTIAFAIRGLKEFGEPARKALILAYAAEGPKGRAVGAYYLIRDTIISLAALPGAALWNVGPQYNLWVAAAVGACGTALYVAMLRGQPQTRTYIHA